MTEATISPELIRERLQNLGREDAEIAAEQARLAQRRSEIVQEVADLKATARAFGMQIEDDALKIAESQHAEIMRNTLRMFNVKP